MGDTNACVNTLRLVLCMEVAVRVAAWGVGLSGRKQTLVHGPNGLYFTNSCSYVPCKNVLACPWPLLGQASETGRYEALLLVRRKSFDFLVSWLPSPG